MSYLHRSRSPGTWNPTLVPTCPVEIADRWKGLVTEAWLPGVSPIGIANGHTLSVEMGAYLPGAPSAIGPACRFSANTILRSNFTPSGSATLMVVGLTWLYNGDGIGSAIGTCQHNPQHGIGIDFGNAYGNASGLYPEVFNGEANTALALNGAIVSDGTSMVAGRMSSAAAAFTNAETSAAGAAGLGIGGMNISGAIYNLNGLVALAAAFSYTASAADICLLTTEPFSIFAPIVRRQYYQTLSGSAWSAIFMASSFSGSSSPGNTARSGLVLSTDIDAALAVAKVARAASVQAVDINAISAAARAGRGSVAISSDTDTTYGIAKIGRGGMAMSSDTDTTYVIAKIGRCGKANSADASSQTAAANAGRGGVALTSAGISGATALSRAARVAKAIGAGISALYAAASKASVGGHPASVLFSSLSAIGASAKASRSSLADVWVISTASAAGKSARLGKIQSVDASSTSSIARVGRVGLATSSGISGAPARASAARSAKAISAGISAAVALAAKQTSAGTAWFGSHTATGISALTGRATVARKGLSVVGSVSASTLKSAVARVGRSAASALSGFVAFWGGSLTPSTWTPSQRRTVRWIDYQALGGMGVMAAKAAMQWPIKRAADADDFVVDYSGLLTDCGDTLTGVSVTCSPSDLTVVWAATFGTNAVAFLSGGTAGQDYSVTVTATTAQGRVVNSIVQLQVTT